MTGLTFRNNNTFPLTGAEIDDNFEYLAKNPLMLDIQSFGAKGNETTDDSAAFIDAINELKGAGGGIIRCNRPAYLVDEPLVIDDSHIWIEGMGHVFFQAAVGAGAGTPPATYSVGIVTDTDKYDTGLTRAANTTSGSPNYTDQSFVPAQEIVLTANTLFGGGTVRVTAYYFEATETYE